jgi:hypothetical protein
MFSDDDQSINLDAVPEYHPLWKFHLVGHEWGEDAGVLEIRTAGMAEAESLNPTLRT